MNPKVVDEYGEILHCDSYKKSYRNDFEWNQVRQTIQGVFMQQKATYRTLYEFGGPIFLDRYDFKTQAFPLAEESAQKNVGSMVMFNNPDFVPYCTRTQKAENFPQNFVIELRSPINLERLYMDQKQADAFITRMQNNNNHDRMVYVRFRAKLYGARGVEGLGIGRHAVVEGEIEDIDFFEDRDYTIFLGSGR